MKRLSENLSAVILIVLLAAWGWSTGELARAACLSPGCTNKCFPWTGWCFLDPVSGKKTHNQYATAIPFMTGCTDAAAPGGTPALFQMVTFDIYNNCTPDCTTDVTKTSASTAAQAGKMLGSDSGTYKTQCKAS